MSKTTTTEIDESLFDDVISPDEKLYCTADLGLAAAMVCIKTKIAKIDKTNPQKIVFCFKYDFPISHYIESYWNERGLQVYAREHFQAIKYLKNLIHSGDVRISRADNNLDLN
jgi:hypothetical protein